MCVDQALESLESQGCADYDNKTGTETVGLMGDSEVRYSVLQVCIMLMLHAQCQLQKHGSSCGETTGPLPSECGITAGGMSSVRDVYVISGVAERQLVKDVVPVHLLPTDRRVISDGTLIKLDVLSAARVAQSQSAADLVPMRPPPSECLEVSDDISRITQRKPDVNVATMRSLPSECEMVSDDESHAESEVQERAREKHEEARIQRELRNLGVCVQGFPWIKQPLDLRHERCNTKGFYSCFKKGWQ